MDRRCLCEAPTYCDSKSGADYLCRLARKEGLVLMQRKQDYGWLVMRCRRRRGSPWPLPSGGTPAPDAGADPRRAGAPPPQ